MASILYILALTPLLLCHYFFDLTLCLLPSGRPVKEWTLNQAIRVRTVRLLLYYWSLYEAGDRLHLNPGRERERFEVIQPQSKRLYIGPLDDASIRPETIGATWTPARLSAGASANPKTTVVLHFHGGAFVIGDGRDGDTGFLARTLVTHMGCTHVCTPQYRLSSSEGGHFPAPLQDALTSYLHLLRELRIPASQIIVSGDSAGANIVVALLRYISEYGQKLDIPIPAAAALWSPWTDVGAALDAKLDMKTLPNYSSDYLNVDFARWGSHNITAHGAVDGSGPYLSPVHHPFELGARIPVFVNIGGRELMYDHILQFCEVFTSHGWHICTLVSKGCPHDILLLGPRLGFLEEAEAAVRDARAFLLSETVLHLQSSD
ncbi:Alpha/Beta hydrolase protein [Xylaria nigripes]|nr:Alpha/Beta hydrolase protein [Xylaria nigripes]